MLSSSALSSLGSPSNPTNHPSSLINNAGISWESRHSPMKLHDLPEEAFDQTIAVNLKSVWLGCRAVVGQMLRQECHQPGNHRGWIINVSSIFGLVGSRMARKLFSLLCTSDGRASGMES
jgi:NAD(P)-dependent dehydrogenase (short-subunit alcohol dehydrogenase family)